MKIALAAFLALLLSSVAAAETPLAIEKPPVSDTEDPGDPGDPATTDAPARHPNISRGLDPNKTVVGDLDSVNLFNGNLTLSIPIGQRYPLSSRLSYQLALHYNSSVWDFEQFEDSNLHITVTQALPNRRSNAGVGWSLSLGRLYSPNHITNETGRWLYEGPDGGDHSFFPTLHENEPITTNFAYTRDGSYLRMQVSGDRRLVEFPDGSVHEFEAAPEGPWRLRVIRDRHQVNGIYQNRLDVDYQSNAAGSVNWVLTDTQSRSHTVRFKRVWIDGALIDVVDSITLAGVGAKTPTYTFTYTENLATVRPCTDDDDRVNGSSQRVGIAVLSSLSVPELPPYSFTYNIIDQRTFCPESRRSTDNASATIQSADLPTGGSISWGWTEYRFASPSDKPLEVFIQSTWGVGSRTVSDPARNTVATWSYTPLLDEDPQDAATSPPNVLTNTVIDPAGNRTEHYFNVRRSDFNDAYYGMPFNPLLTDSSTPLPRFLSHREYEGGNGTSAQLRRSHYVRYEHDPGLPTVADNHNVRVVSNMTLYADDYPNASEAGMSWSKSSGFDGLGNYRTVITDGNFNSANVSASFIDYNPNRKDYPGTGARVFVMIPTTDPWILGTYTSAKRTEGGSATVRQYCFDSATGALERARTLAGATPSAVDLLEVYTRDNSGNVVRRDLYGGDGATLNTSAPLCTMGLPTLPSSRAVHTWSGGVMTSTQYHEPSADEPSAATAMPFKSFDVTVDTDTGLPLTKRDVSGLETSFTYDTAGRVKTMDLPGNSAGDELTVSYSYPNATSVNGFKPSEVVTTRGSGSTLVRSASQFDGLGRPWREKTLMPDGTTVRETQLNASGWVTKVSEPETLEIPANGTEFDFVPAHFTVFSDFDLFGRPRLTTLPDMKTTSVTYNGARLVTTTRDVATTNAGGETPVSTIEEYDRQGRLWKVTENSGSTSDQVVTTYGYDAADRLISVSTTGHGFTQQSRTFTYDGRGFLGSESHPESGATSYQYDARGQITRRQTPLRVLLYTYDDAGRIETVTEEGLGTIKEFAYDRANDGADYSLGKTDYALRHNRQPVLGGDIVVTETYRYFGVGGRLSSKETSLSTGESFVDSYTYNTLGLLNTIELPECGSCPDDSAFDAPSVQYKYTNGLLSSVTGYASSIAYHANGVLKSIRHLNADGTSGPLYAQTLHSSGMGRTGSIAVSDTCSNLSVTQQPSGGSVNPNQSTTLSAVIAGATSYQWYSTANGVDTILIGQTTASIQVSPSATTSYFLRGSNGVCAIDSATVVVTVTACPSPAPSISTVSSMSVSSTSTATVSVAPGASVTSYVWSVTNGTLVTGQGSATVTFRAGCTGPVGLTVDVSTSCTTDDATASVNITPMSATLSAQPQTISSGSSSELTATLTGTGPWDITWVDGGGAQENVPSPITRNVSPTQTTSYTMTAVNPYGCSITTSSVSVTVKPPAPWNVLATAQTATSVIVQWSFSGTANSFEIHRYYRPANAPNTYHLVGTSSSAARSFTDTSAPAGTAILYRVIAIRGGTASDPSVADLATTVIFGPDIQAGALIDDDPIAKLRTAVNAVRTLAIYSSSTFTDPSLTGAYVRVPHVQELRTSLGAARAALDLPPIAWIDHPLTTSHFVRAAHINQLLEGIE